MQQHEHEEPVVAKLIEPVRTQRSAMAKRGFVYVCICCGIILLMNLVSIALTRQFSLFNFFVLPPLVLVMFIGHSWARWTVILLLAVLVSRIGYVFGVIAYWNGFNWSSPLLWLCLTYIVIGGVLALVPSVNEFYNPNAEVLRQMRASMETNQFGATDGLDFMPMMPEEPPAERPEKQSPETPGD